MMFSAFIYLPLCVIAVYSWFHVKWDPRTFGCEPSVRGSLGGRKGAFSPILGAKRNKLLGGQTTAEIPLKTVLHMSYFLKRF
jgi:hypothetical protein